VQEREPVPASAEDGAELRVTQEDARHVANLLRYAVSLNTAVGLVSPTERRLATSTYRAAELAALVLEGRTFDEALTEANERWTGVLKEDHRHALKLLGAYREGLRRAMSGRLTPEQLAEYLEITQDQLLELVRPKLAPPNKPKST
jgi:hypothetical protein